VAGRGESWVEFTAPALGALYEGSSGVPRLINRICDRALQHAYASQTMQIDAEFVWTAIADLGLSVSRDAADRSSPRRPAASSARAAAADAKADADALFIDTTRRPARSRTRLHRM
jgi:hypothetical protein